jgi:hypothetical protein
MSPQFYTQYIKEMLVNHGYWAIWEPGVQLALGTVGEFQHEVFVPTSDLASYGINFKVKKDKTPSNIEHQTAGNVVVAVKAKGETQGAFKTLSELDAGFGVDFERADAVLFVARGCYEERIADIDKLKRDVKALPGDTFPRGHAVITHLVQAQSATILISSSNGARIELKADADIGHDIGSIADVSAELSTAYQRAMGSYIVAASGLTPLFRAICRKIVFPGKTDVVFASDLDAGEWEEVNYATIFG